MMAKEKGTFWFFPRREEPECPPVGESHIPKDRPRPAFQLL
jgi:hypothetical protein